jgi:hypothetical protein
MNEFTKGELEIIYDGLCNLMKLGWIKTNLQLNKKIQSMIDNYCEHEKVVPNYGPNTQCTECGMLW